MSEGKELHLERRRVVRVKQVIVVLLAALMLVALGCQQQKAVKPKPEAKKEAVGRLILATTTSTVDTGLLDELVPLFEKENGAQVKVVAVGTGEALKMGERGDADVLLVHSKKSEEELVAKGFGVKRIPVMHNDFVIIGPADDPAKIKGSTAADAFKKIASANATFVSRGDDSGTHKKEKAIWESSQINPAESWYIQSGQGMGETIRIANEKRGYTLADRGTFLASEGIELVVLVEKDPILLNPYGVIVVNPDKYPRVNHKGAQAFIEFLTSPRIQKMIGEFGQEKYGEPLFVPDALE